MIKENVMSVEELKNNFNFEDFKQEALKGYLKNNLDRYLDMQSDYRLLALVESIVLRCTLYFEDIISTYNMWSLDLSDNEKAIRLKYNLYISRNKHLDVVAYNLSFLREENGVYTFEFNEYNVPLFDEEKEMEQKHDMEVGRFMLHCCVDLLNNLLQEQEVEK